MTETCGKCGFQTDTLTVCGDRLVCNACKSEAGPVLMNPAVPGETESCASCRFAKLIVGRTDDVASAAAMEGQETHHCRRYAPGTGVDAMVTYDWWCGDYEAKR